MCKCQLMRMFLVRIGKSMLAQPGMVVNDSVELTNKF